MTNWGQAVMLLLVLLWRPLLILGLVAFVVCLIVRKRRS